MVMLLIVRRRAQIARGAFFTIPAVSAMVGFVALLEIAKKVFIFLLCFYFQTFVYNFFFILLLCITFFYLIKYEIIEIKRKIIINNIDLSPFHPSSLLWFKLEVGKWGVCFFYKIYTSISNLECWS